MTFNVVDHPKNNLAPFISSAKAAINSRFNTSRVFLIVNTGTNKILFVKIQETRNRLIVK